MRINRERRRCLQVLSAALTLMAGAGGEGVLAAALSGTGQDEDDDQFWDVIVVGSGLAGCAAALSALEAGSERNFIFNII